ncbi:MAG: PA14 domain-containing protein [Isosphaeraceae bacterium]|nr:PA14 domain-containing protein [Isosphaeraceae bacterium]
MHVWTTCAGARGRRATSRRRRTAPVLYGERLERRTLLSVGGGFTNSGLLGQYYPNTSLSGTPAFTRQDDRIDFNWGSDVVVGGSTSPGFNAVGPTNFSVQWTGQVVPNFSETYTFTTESDDGVRLFIRPTGSSAWSELIDDWTPHAVTADSGSYTVTAGQSYDIRLEYFQASGGAYLQLDWSSPSTPREVIDPLSTAGINAVTYVDQIYADAMKSARVEWGSPTNYFPLVPADANGWPLADATKVVWEGQDPTAMTGTYLLQFQGEATVTTGFSLGEFAAGGQSYGTTLPAGAGYNAVTNTTTATMQIAPNPLDQILYLTFTNTQRTPSSPLGSGLTDISLMKPTAPGASTYYSPGTLFDANVEAAFADYTTERWLTANNNTTEVNWSDRVLPGFAQAAFADNHTVWEYLVMLANETGKDLYITVPVNASPDYVTKLAELIRYGSDGVNPYTTPQADPVYPGLNPNLRVYVEWSNEVWNSAFSQNAAAVADASAAVQDGTPDGAIINYDGNAPNGDFRRWVALRTVQASDSFRSVFGDAAMGNQVRMVLEFQYNGWQDTASTELQFIDDYFDNADGRTHVADPHPVNYYLWGAGAAAYFTSGNPTGAQDIVVFGNSGFESSSAAIAPGTALADPTGAAWSFTGDAGIYHDEVTIPAAASQTLGNLTQPTDGASDFGYEFTVGNQNVGVYELGRWVAPGDTEYHTVEILQAGTMAVVASAGVNTAGVAPGQYAYTTLTRPAVLSANTTYLIVSNEDGHDPFYDETTHIAASPGITLGRAVSLVGNPSAWTIADGPAGNAFGPVDFRFAAAPVGNLGFVPNSPEGSQAAYIDGSGTMSQTIDFPSTGTFALQITAANKDGAPNALRVFVDNVEITPYLNSYTPTSIPWTPGSGTWGIDDRNYNTVGTAPFTITTPGFHTITIVGTGSAGSYTFLDAVQVTSADAIFAGGIPGIGDPGTAASTMSANYQAQLNLGADFALTYGLQVVAYEGGWALGGDGGGTPLQNYAKFVDPRAEQANLDSLTAFERSGGALYVFGTYDQWPTDNSAQAASFPLLQAIVAASKTAPATPTNALTNFGSLTLANRTLASQLAIANGVGTLPAGGWLTWNILVAQPGTYTFTLNMGTGGSVLLSIDGSNHAVVAAPNGGQAVGTSTLSRGLHTVRVSVTSGLATFATLDVNKSSLSTSDTGSLSATGTVPVATLPAWLSPDSVATWDASSRTLTVAGAVTIISDPGSDSPIIIASGPAAQITIKPSTVGFVHFGGVSLANGALIVVPSVPGRTHTNHNVIVIDSAGGAIPIFSIDATSKFDLQDNDLIVQNGNLAAIEAAAAEGRDLAAGNTWDGNGLTSSTAETNDANQGYEQTLLGVGLNGNLIDGSYATWQAGTSTMTLGPNDVIVKYTYNGDFDLNGMVDDNDAGILGGDYGAIALGNDGFIYGDTDGNGTVDDNDVGMFGLFYGSGTHGDQL